jgi:DNA invertase Pin-like site-specific DNA recombinase
MNQKHSINKAQVKKSLPYGAIKEIAFRSKTSIYTVSRVLNRGGKNTKVLNALKDYIEEIQQTNETINKLVEDSKITC